MDRCRHIIDVHHHIAPDFYRDGLAKLGVTKAGGAQIAPWKLEDSFAYMERWGIDSIVAGISEPAAIPYIQAGDIAGAKKACREVNEYMAELKAKYPAKFGGFAMLPMPDVDASIEEARHALQTLKLDGVVLMSNYGTEFLGNREFAPLFDELDSYGTVVYVHPSAPPKDYKKPEFVPLDFVQEFTFNTTRAASNLVYSGTVVRCPNLKFIFSHMGGCFPYLKYRYTTSWNLVRDAHKVPVADYVWDAWESLRVKDTVKHLGDTFYFDCALSTEPVDFVGVNDIAPGHILYGSDHLFTSAPTVEANFRNIDRFFEDEADRHAIFRGNAERLFPQFSK